MSEYRTDEGTFIDMSLRPEDEITRLQQRVEELEAELGRLIDIVGEEDGDIIRALLD